jgi:hypothetical protein
VVGEPVEIYPWLGSSRLEEPLTRFEVTAAFHGHAHKGAPEGRTSTGIPVYNVSLSVLKQHYPDKAPFRVFEIPRDTAVASAEPTEAELELFVPEATREVARALDQDSIPVERTEARDGWLETAWFDARTMRPTNAWPVGPDVVKVRAFVDPGRPNHSVITVETVYRPVADPSRAGRELERQVPANHPVAIKVAIAINRLVQTHARPEEESVPPLSPAAPPDTTTRPPAVPRPL